MFIENIKEAISSIFSNKMRSVLTMLGIIIGISAVITITTIGNSIRSTLNSTFSSLGGSGVTCYMSPVYPETDEEWDNWEYPEIGEEDYATAEMVDELVERYPDDITGLAVQNYYQSGKVTLSTDCYANVATQGVSAGYIEYQTLKFSRGRDISKADIKGKKNVCVISDVMANNVFPDRNPIGQYITVEFADGSSVEVVVVGVYEYSNAVFGKPNTSVAEKDRETVMYLPYTLVSKLTGAETTGLEYFTILVNPQADGDQAVAEVKEFFDEKYEDNPTWHVECYSISQELGIVDTVINVITIAISLIAAISLIVGGVGVMNIMLVSITERTKEIGIRMALGAKPKTIRTQFLIEAIVLCLIGGVIGILIGILNGFLLGQIAEMLIKSYYADYAHLIVLSVRPSVTAILLSLFFSMLIGVFFGHYPAKKASKMEVIDALRYE